MLSQQRFAAEAGMAKTAKEAAQSDEEFELYDKAWAAYLTASNHALLAVRWRMAATSERQVASAPAVTDVWTMRFSPRRVSQLASPETLEERVLNSIRKAELHEKAAEECGGKAAELYVKAQRARQGVQQAPNHQNQQNHQQGEQQEMQRGGERRERSR